MKETECLSPMITYMEKVESATATGWCYAKFKKSTTNNNNTGKKVTTNKAL